MLLGFRLVYVFLCYGSHPFRNMFALGLVCWLFNRPVDKATAFLESKFQKKPQLIAPNVKVLTDGYNYGNNLALNIQTVNVEKSHDLPKGTYTSIADPW